MVITTNSGLERIADLVKNDVTTIALGTGTSPEQPTDTALEKEVYRQSVGASNISILDQPGSAVLYQLAIKGGTQIPGGTEITEIGLFADRDDDGTAETLVVRDVSGIREISNGYFSIFQIRLPIQRPSGGTGA